MFDEQLPTGTPATAGQIPVPPPQNPPVQPPPLPGPADDMFSGVDGSAPSASQQNVAPSAPVASAVPQAGVIGASSGIGIGKIVGMSIAGVLLLGGIGGGVWWYLNHSSEGEVIPYGDDGLDASLSPDGDILSGDDGLEMEPTPAIGTPPTSDTSGLSTDTQPVEQGTPTPTTPSAPLAPEQPVIVDGDGDGLTDDEEARYGTSSRKPDTDNDGLFDREEVIVYRTNPLSPDSDNDTYPDGSEVQKGYNPNGPGKLVNTPGAQP